MNVLFLLGAGISRDVLPLSARLTDIVLSAHAGGDSPWVVFRHSDAMYYFGHSIPPGTEQKWLHRSVEFLRWLRAADSSSDYEALYFACQQIHDHLTEEYENPLLVPFIAQCAAQLDWLWRDELGTEGEWRDARLPSAKLAELTREAMNYIDGVVRWTLDQTADLRDLDPRFHAALLDACRDKEVRRVDVVTLNHDTLLERVFARAAMPFEDGFTLDRRGASLWHRFEWKRAEKVRLVKLHGSIDWWRFRPRGPADRIIRGMAGDNLSWNALERRPVVLVGTFNKMLDYLRAPHIEHLAVFRRALLRCSSVVVAGYSFRDKGVNGLLIGTDRRNRRIVVIDPSVTASEPPSTARPAISRAWGRWLTEGRLVPVRSRFSDTNWPDLKVQLQGH